MAVLIIFPVIFYTVINSIMLTIGGQGQLNVVGKGRKCWCHSICEVALASVVTGGLLVCDMLEHDVMYCDRSPVVVAIKVKTA